MLGNKKDWSESSCLHSSANISQLIRVLSPICMILNAILIDCEQSAVLRDWSESVAVCWQSSCRQTSDGSSNFKASIGENDENAFFTNWWPFSSKQPIEKYSTLWYSVQLYVISNVLISSSLLINMHIYIHLEWKRPRLCIVEKIQDGRHFSRSNNKLISLVSTMGLSSVLI